MTDSQALLITSALLFPHMPHALSSHELARKEAVEEALKLKESVRIAQVKADEERVKRLAGGPFW